MGYLFTCVMKATSPVREFNSEERDDGRERTVHRQHQRGRTAREFGFGSHGSLSDDMRRKRCVGRPVVSVFGGARRFALGLGHASRASSLTHRSTLSEKSSSSESSHPYPIFDLCVSNKNLQPHTSSSTRILTQGSVDKMK